MDCTDYNLIGILAVANHHKKKKKKKKKKKNYKRQNTL